MRPKEFYQLWELAAELAPTTRSGTLYGAKSTFDCSSVGLLLEPDEGRWEYHTTPLNADTFAGTGGEGVHFSFLLIPGVTPEKYPVVMTVPMGIDHNFVVGDSFIEFLSLGCRLGYFGLESLDYDWNQTVEELQRGLPDPESADEYYLITAICERFNLQPWPNVAERLRQLEAHYHGLIQFPG